MEAAGQITVPGRIGDGYPGKDAMLPSDRYVVASRATERSSAGAKAARPVWREAVGVRLS